MSSFLILLSLLLLFMRFFCFSFFFFNDTATTEIYTLSLHDALPIFCMFDRSARISVVNQRYIEMYNLSADVVKPGRSEEHTSELQSLRHLVCRLLLEKKKKTDTRRNIHKIVNSTHIPHTLN